MTQQGSGEYESPRDREQSLQELRAKIDLAWEQSERGEGRDGRIVFAELRKKIREGSLPNAE